jgi:PAB1-binding protein PBP1
VAVLKRIAESAANVRNREGPAMAKKVLSKAQKEKMQSARVTVKAERQKAENLLLENPQFTNPKFWATIDPILFGDVEAAIAKAKRAFKRELIRELEKELEALKQEEG